MIPDYVWWWFEGASHHTVQNHGAAGFHISVGIADQFGSRYCVAREGGWEGTLENE